MHLSSQHSAGAQHTLENQGKPMQVSEHPGSPQRVSGLLGALTPGLWLERAVEEIRGYLGLERVVLKEREEGTHLLQWAGM